MALDFPSSPSSGQLYAAPNGTTYVFNGAVWAAQQFAVQAPMAAPGGVCRVGKTANQSIANGAVVLVTWDTESRDDYDAHSNTVNNSRITVPAGVSFARFRCGMCWTTNNSGQRSIIIQKNSAGTTAPFSTIAHDTRVGTSESGHLTDTGIIAVTPGDHFEVWVYQASGGALSIIGPAASYQFAAFFEAEFYTTSTTQAPAVVWTGTTPPSSPATYPLWYHSDLGRTFISYYDGSSTQWVDANPVASGSPVLLERWYATGVETSKTFSSLGSFTDLIVRMNWRQTTGNANINLFYNGDTTAANYNVHWWNSSGAVNYTALTSISGNGGATPAAGYSHTAEFEIQGYAGTAFKKRAHGRSDMTDAVVAAPVTHFSSIWNNTAAITSMQFVISTGAFAAGSTIAIYGRY